MEIDERYIKKILEAVDEYQKIEALFELKHEYLRIKTKEENLTKHNSSSKKDCFYGIDDHDFTPEEKKELSEIRRY